VEASKFCLFSVVLPAMCVSSISPRFHYRRHAFCFLPLATILEFCGFLCLVLIALIKLLNFVTLTFTNFKNYWLLSV
jgi:long-subunit acyl-CoA synthetase (AMP-forming)